jgi:putative transposase
VDVILLAVELAELRAEVRADGLHDLLHAFQVFHGEHLMPVLGDENQVNVQEKDTVSASADSFMTSHETKYDVLVQLRYNYRLDPAPRHRKAFARAFGCARVVVNDALQARQRAHQAGLPYITDAELSARLTAAKKTPGRAWLNEVSAVVLQQALADLNTAYWNFFASVTGKRKGPKVAPPRFRSRKDHRQAIRFTANARFKILPSEPSSVTVIKDAAGRYFASFVVEAEPGSLPATGPVLGIDLGLTHFAVLSDGRKIASPQFLRRAEKVLRRRQQDLSRKQQGSKNRAKARLKLAHAHARVADARREFHHQLSTALIRDNQAVAVEDLAVKGLACTRLAKSVHDAGWASFVTMLEYKARLYGRQFHRIGRFEPTSQVCSACGTKDGPKPLHVRTWQCHGCGAWLDRDINAAINVAKAAGLAVTACGAQVRPGPVPAQRGEAGTHPISRQETA